MKEPLLDSLAREWEILHHGYERYEQCSLGLKVLGVIVCLACIVAPVIPILSILLILTLWLMDGIWKTFQARMGERILRIEKALSNAVESTVLPFQFYTQWEMNRPGIMSLLKEYVLNSVRPTVVYPYFVLVLITILPMLW